MVNGNIEDLLKILKKQFENHFMQIPFIAKNQIVLFLYSEDIFEMDEMVQKATSVENVIAVENFMPKKISLPQDWIKKAMRELGYVHLTNDPWEGRVINNEFADKIISSFKYKKEITKEGV